MTQTTQLPLAPKKAKKVKKQKLGVATKIYSYSVPTEMQCKRPALLEPTPRDEIIDQLKKAETYYNNLVTIENARRAEITAVRIATYPAYEPLVTALAAAQTRVDEVLAECKDYRRQHLTTKVSKELTQKLASAKQVRTTASAAEKAMRKAIWLDPKFLAVVGQKVIIQPPTKKGKKTPKPKEIWAPGTIEDKANKAQSKARHASGVFWGTYQAVEEAIKAAKSKKKGGDLATKKRYGEGCVAYHFQSSCAPMTWARALSGTDNRMKIYADPVQHPHSFQREQLVTVTGDPRIFSFRGVRLMPGGTVMNVFRPQDLTGTEEAMLQLYDKDPTKLGPVVFVPFASISHYSAKQKHWWCEFWLRTEGTGKKAKPVYVKVPWTLHRELPPNCQITWVKLHKFKCGTHWKHELQFTINHVELTRTILDGKVGIDVGWRHMEDGSVRAAYWYGSDDQHGEVLIPARRVQAWLHGRMLQETRDDRFNLMRDRLLAWLKAYPNLPQTHVDRFKTLPLWKSSQGLVGAYHWWLVNRIPNDEEILGAAQPYNYQDHDTLTLHQYVGHENHLYDYQTNERHQFMDWRQWYYRNVVTHKLDGLVRQYGRAKVEEIELDMLQRLPVPGEEKPADFCKKYKNLTACSIFLGAVKEGFGAAQVTMVKTPYTTMQCHKCKGICATGAALIHTCEHCGCIWDQDYNAARNILECPANCIVVKATPTVPVI